MPRLHWRYVLAGAALTVGLNLVFGFLGAASGSPGVVIALSIIALLLAGALTMRLSVDVLPREPALGAAIVTALLAAFQLSMVARRQVPGMRPIRLLIAWLFSITFAGALTWLGARTMQKLRSRRPSPPASQP